MDAVRSGTPANEGGGELGAGKILNSANPWRRLFGDRRGVRFRLFVEGSTVLSECGRFSNARVGPVGIDAGSGSGCSAVGSEMRRVPLHLFAGILLIPALPVQLFQRDQLRPPATGTARIEGEVLTTDPPPQAVRRAIVSLYSGADDNGRHVMSDDDGHFSFEALPAGRYELSAARPSFVSISYGARKPGRPGAPIILETGQRVTDVRVLLARGAVITGTVRDASGEPLPDTEVRVEPRDGRGHFITRTDDLGAYRMFGLAAGTYWVSARPQAVGTNERYFPSDAEVDEALRQLKQRQSAQGRAVPAASTTPRDAVISARALDFAPVYHPSAFMTEEAGPVAVRPGEERAGVDVLVRMMSTSVVSGQVLDLANVPSKDVEITLTRAGSKSPAEATRATLQRDGAFRFATVRPGRYLLAVRSLRDATLAGVRNEPARGAGAEDACLSATQEVLVNGTDQSDLILVLRPCLRIEGQIVFADSAALAKPTSLAGLRVTLQPDSTQGIPSYAPLRAPAQVGVDGRFRLGEFGEVLRGAYRLTVLLPRREIESGWRLRSMSAGGQDVLDAPIEITAASPPITNVVVTFGEDTTSLSGTLRFPPGSSAEDYMVLAFSTNRAWWRTSQRRVQAVRPAATGQYEFEDLPAGEYYVIALTELAPDDFRDPGFLDEIVGSAIKLTVTANERKVQDLRIGGTPHSARN